MEPADQRRRQEILKALKEWGVAVPAASGALDQPLLTTSQVAQLLRTSDRTIRTWADEGKIEAMRTLGGRRLFPARAVIAALESMVGTDEAPHKEGGSDGGRAHP